MANSHFIQQKFITMFTKEKGIYVYDKKEKHPLDKLFNAKTIAYQKDLYKLELKDLCEYFGKDLSNTYPNWNADGLELALKEFEDSGMNVITKITQQETLDLSDDEKIDLIAYLIVSSKRTPSIKKLEEFIYNDLPVPAKEKKNVFIRKLINKDDLNAKIQVVLSDYKMMLLKNENDAFVFSDNWCAQFTFLPPEIFIPLTSSLGILFKDNSRKPMYTDHDSYKCDTVNVINSLDVVEYNQLHQIAFAERWIYGAYTHSVINFLKKLYPLLNAENVEIKRISKIN